MIELVGRTLRLVFGQPAPAIPAEPMDPRPIELRPEIEFSAYTEDFRLFGHLRLEGERLTDMLNGLDELILIDAMVESLTDGMAYEVDELAVMRDELVAVEASGPRGNPARRVRVRPFPIGVKLGPYLVRGYVHVTPGANPVLAVRRKRLMVPLTEATIEYQRGGTRIQRRSSTILFNRELADWIAPTVDEAIEYPDIPIAVDHSPLAKDFTGQILLEPWSPAGPK
jgi:hypothetical protein